MRIMTEPVIIPKIAYIALESRVTPEVFLDIWNDMQKDRQPTQKDYDEFCMDYAKQFYYDERGELEKHIKLMEDN